MRERVQGGSTGLIAAIVSGRLDPFSGQTEREREFLRLNGPDWRERKRREDRRERKRQRRVRDRLADLCPF